MFNKKQEGYFFLKNQKEELIMQVLWESEKPLSATEIAERIPNRNWPASSIQSILKGLEKKNAIRVSKIDKIGKVYGRFFEPTLSANEYATMQFSHFYQHDEKNYFSVISSLLGNSSDNKEEIIETLEALLDEYKGE